MLLIKQTTDCFSDVCSTEQKCQLSYRLFNWFNALIFLEKNCVPSPNFLILSPQLRQFSETLGVDPTGDRPFPPWNRPPTQGILVHSCLQ